MATNPAAHQDSEVIRLHATVQGHVQGVGFRMFVLQAAQALGVNGFVRNTWEGDVEVVAEGERKILELLLVDLRRGPRGAHVINVTIRWLAASGEFKRFGMLQTM